MNFYVYNGASAGFIRPRSLTFYLIYKLFSWVNP
jgi:hypothetical protein